MIAPRNPLEAPSNSAASPNPHAEHLRRQRLFQQDSQASTPDRPRMASILVPSENGEELEQLVCRMD